MESAHLVDADIGVCFYLAVNKQTTNKMQNIFQYSWFMQYTFNQIH